MKFNQLSTYGLLAHLRQTEAVELIDALIAVRYIEQIDVDRFRPGLQLTADGQAVMTGRVDLLVALSLSAGVIAKLARAAKATAAKAPPAIAATEPAIAAGHEAPAGATVAADRCAIEGCAVER